MGKANFSDELKRDAVSQLVDLGCPVSEVCERMGVSQHLLYAWKRKFAKGAPVYEEKDAGRSTGCKSL